MNKSLTNNSLIICYRNSTSFNHSWFFDDAPESLFCDNCGCCLDDNYFPSNMIFKNRADISATYDGRYVLSRKFKEYIELFDFEIDFLPACPDGSFFFIKSAKIIEYGSAEKGDYCNKCGQYFSEVVPVPDFYFKSGRILEDGIFLTSTRFGGGKTKSPSLILGINTALKMKNDNKKLKLRGLRLVERIAWKPDGYLIETITQGGSVPE